MPESKPSQRKTSDINTSAGKFTVSAEQAGRRLDQFLAVAMADVSRTRVKQLIDQQKVLVNGSLQKPSYATEPGDEISVIGEVKAPPLHAEPEDIPLEILYEDGSLAVLNK